MCTPKYISLIYNFISERKYFKLNFLLHQRLLNWQFDCNNTSKQLSYIIKQRMIKLLCFVKKDNSEEFRKKQRVRRPRNLPKSVRRKRYRKWNLTKRPYWNKYKDNQVIFHKMHFLSFSLKRLFTHVTIQTKSNTFITWSQNKTIDLQ